MYSSFTFFVAVQNRWNASKRFCQDAGMLKAEDKRKYEKLIAEQERLEEDSEVELLVKMLSSVNDDSSSGDIYGDGDQSPLKG